MRKILFLLALAGSAAWAENANCDRAQLAVINFTGTSGVAVPVVGYQKIRVCKIYLTSSAATSLNLVSVGSGNNASGTIQNATAWQAEKVDGAFYTLPGEALGVASSVSATITGSIAYYREQP